MRIMILFLMCLIGCGMETSGQTAKLGEEFTLQNKQSMKIKDVDIELTVNRVGRKWVGKQEEVDLDFSVKHKGEVFRFTNLQAKPFFVGDYEVKVVKVNPFGIENAVFIIKQKGFIGENFEEMLPEKTAKLGEEFSLKLNQAVSFSDSDFAFKYRGIFKEFLRATNGVEINYDRLEIQINGKTSREIIKDGAVEIDGYKIRCVLPYYQLTASFIVTRAVSATDEIAAKFVEKFGWHIDSSIKPSIVMIDFPANFNGLPFYHYQSASQRSGVDMTPLLGKKVEMLKFTLKEKRLDHQTEFISYVHLIIENGKVVGAWRTDSSPSAPGIYSLEKK